MRKTLYTNKKIKLLISNIIYDIQNYNFTILKYTENIDKTDEINEDKDSIIRQSFLIDVTMKAFNDFNDISDFAKMSVINLMSLNIIDGDENYCFRPKNTLTRAQTAKIIYQMLELEV